MTPACGDETGNFLQSCITLNVGEPRSGFHGKASIGARICLESLPERQCKATVTAAGSLDRCKQRPTAKTSSGEQLVEMASGRKQFPTKFVWDHGGSEVSLAINGGSPIHLQREEDGTLR